jgi:DNA-directed RNA polymerase subunit RPC12/RpoP
MDAILRKCLACGEPFTAIDRRSTLCPECRQNVPPVGQHTGERKIQIYLACKARPLFGRKQT